MKLDKLDLRALDKLDLRAMSLLVSTACSHVPALLLLMFRRAWANSHHQYGIAAATRQHRAQTHSFKALCRSLTSCSLACRHRFHLRRLVALQVLLPVLPHELRAQHKHLSNPPCVCVMQALLSHVMSLQQIAHDREFGSLMSRANSNLSRDPSFSDAVSRAVLHALPAHHLELWAQHQHLSRSQTICLMPRLLPHGCYLGSLLSSRQALQHDRLWHVLSAPCGSRLFILMLNVCSSFPRDSAIDVATARQTMCLLLIALPRWLSQLKCLGTCYLHGMFRAVLAFLELGARHQHQYHFHRVCMLPGLLPHSLHSGHLLSHTLTVGACQLLHVLPMCPGKKLVSLMLHEHLRLSCDSTFNATAWQTTQPSSSSLRESMCSELSSACAGPCYATALLTMWLLQPFLSHNVDRHVHTASSRSQKVLSMTSSSSWLHEPLVHIAWFIKPLHIQS